MFNYQEKFVYNYILVYWLPDMSSNFETQLFLSRPFLTRNQVKRAQQNTIGDYRGYNSKRVAIVRFLSDICTHLRFPRRTLETAVYFYLRYHLFKNFETESCYVVATSCLVLSCKEVETIKKVNDICTVSLQLRSLVKVNNEALEGLKKRVFQMELKVLEACSFDYRINDGVHIGDYIIKYGKLLGLGYDVCKLAWIVAYDVLKTELLLIVPQHVISMACIQLACELVHTPIQLANRYEEFSMDPPMCNEAYFELLDFYINSFDTCDLKDVSSEVSLEIFMDLKKKAGPEQGLQEPTAKDIDQDKYLTVSRSSSVRERRYVLSQDLLNEELAD